MSSFCHVFVVFQSFVFLGYFSAITVLGTPSSFLYPYLYWNCRNRNQGKGIQSITKYPIRTTYYHTRFLKFTYIKGRSKTDKQVGKPFDCFQGSWYLHFHLGSPKFDYSSSNHHRLTNLNI